MTTITNYLAIHRFFGLILIIIFAMFLIGCIGPRLESKALSLQEFKRNQIATYEIGKATHKNQTILKKIKIDSKTNGICSLDKKTPVSSYKTKLDQAISESTFKSKAKFFALDFMREEVQKNRMKLIETEAKLMRSEVDCSQQETSSKKLVCIQKNKQLHYELAISQAKKEQLESDIELIQDDIDYAVELGTLDEKMSVEAYAGIIRALDFFAKNPGWMSSASCH